jgi:hypothetical protein
MSKPPLPQPLTDDEAADLDYLWENYEADEWQSALEWARKGDFDPLAECLRSNLAAPPDPMAVRNFLADVLEGKFKKPRNSRAKRNSKRVLFEDAKGRRFYIDKRYLEQATAIKRVRELQAQRRISQAKAIEIAATKLGIDEATLAEYLRNPRPQWGLSGRTAEEMFAGVAKLKE